MVLPITREVALKIVKKKINNKIIIISTCSLILVAKNLPSELLPEVQSLSLPFPESALGLERKVCILEKQCCAE